MKLSGKAVVTDAGPLIALARVLDLASLPAVFTQVLVTPTGLDACLVRADRPETGPIRAAVDAGWLERVAEVSPRGDWGLGAGETSAIDIALSRGLGVLMDDRARRRIASRLGIPAIGVLGVLVLAKRAGIIPQVSPAIDRLIASGHYLKGPVLAEAIQLAGE